MFRAGHTAGNPSQTEDDSRSGNHVWNGFTGLGALVGCWFRSRYARFSRFCVHCSDLGSMSDSEFAGHDEDEGHH
jgi:hypothetical protein